MDFTPIMRIPFSAAPHFSSRVTGLSHDSGLAHRFGAIPAARAAERAANDNDLGGAHGAASDQLLRAALRHFAQHGLGAAREARTRAEEAFFAGDRQAFDWWLGITRTLDRRIADTVIHPRHLPS
ncbi:hypothetical protein [Qipengyuania sp. ASV99]|uniref:hypothetical protein n=1 Tax=Qipengyuania sp. ASV99 TaxID=3399681 RepID=UPI003A4C7198